MFDLGKLLGVFGIIGVYLCGNFLMCIFIGVDELVLFVFNECWEFFFLGMVVCGCLLEFDGSYLFDLVGEIV